MSYAGLRDAHNVIINAIRNEREVITWEEALNSKEDLSPAKYAWGDAPVRPVPRPGSAKLA